MIAQLSGKVLQIEPPQMILEVGGIGYEIWCPLHTFYKIKKANLTIYTQLIIKEDAHTLYGFNTLDEKHIFNELLKVNGVGAKVALAILSTLSVGDISHCIATDNFSILQQTPGIGKKTAQKIIVELKDRLAKLALSSKSDKNKTQPRNKAIFDQALAALISLNFKEREARAMLIDIDPSLRVEEMIKIALQRK